MAQGIIFTNRSPRRIHVWKKYNIASTTQYKWNRWNAVETVTYKWNKWNAVSTTTYTWNKWSIQSSYEDVFTSLSKTNTVGANDRNALYRYIPSLNNVDLIRNDMYGYTLKSWQYKVSPSLSIDPSNWTVLGGYYAADGSKNSNNNLSGIRTLEHVTRAYAISVGSESIYYWITYDTDGYYGLTLTHTKGTTSYGTVTSTSSTAYPNGGAQDGYWYDDRTSTTTWSKGTTSYTAVTSTNSTAYPDNGRSGSYWYESAGSTSSWSKGSTKYSDVTSTNASAYPNGGRSGSYWYDNRTSEIIYSIGTYVEDVLSLRRDTYPDNGTQGTYWYVYQGQM